MSEDKQQQQQGNLKKVDEEPEMDLEGALDRSAQSVSRPSSGCILAMTQPSSELQEAQRVADDLNQQDREAKKAATASSTSSRGRGGNRRLGTGSMESIPEQQQQGGQEQQNHSRRHLVQSQEVSAKSIQVVSTSTLAAFADQSLVKDGRALPASSDHSISKASGSNHGRSGRTSNNGSRPTLQPGAFRSGGIPSMATQETLSGDELISEVLLARSTAASHEIHDDVEIGSLDHTGTETNDNAPPVNGSCSVNHHHPNHNEEFMVEATLVSTDASQQLAIAPQPSTEAAVYSEAHALDEGEIATSFLRTKRGRLIVCCVCFLILILIAAFVVSAVFIETQLSSSNSENAIPEPSTTNDAAATEAPTPAVITSITAPTVTTTSTSSAAPTQHTLQPTAQSTHSEGTQILYGVIYDQMVDQFGPPNITLKVSDHAIDAMAWMQADPFLDDLSALEKHQRVILMLLYFATQGQSWKENTGWSQYRATECTWYMSPYNKNNNFRFPNAITSTAATTTIGDGSLLQAFIDNGGNLASSELPSRSNNNQICDEQGELQQINLHSNLLNGTIPPELLLLGATLESLILANNTLQGGIPTELGTLSMLRILDLNSNINLGGTLPSELGQLEALRFLDLSSSQLSGSIPAQLGMNQALTYWNCKDNLLTGSISRQLFLLSSLKVLDLSSNYLIGSLSTELGQMSGLLELVLNNNNFNGTLPWTLGNLSAMTNLNLESNLLIGFLPSELGLLSRLSTLNVGSNKLIGSLPSELSGMTSLCRVNISNNQLYGTIPAELGQACYGITDMQQEQSLNGSQPVFVRGLLRIKANAQRQRAEILSSVNDTFATSINIGKDWSEALESFSVEATDVYVGEWVMEMKILITAWFSPGYTPPTRRELGDHLMTSESEMAYSWVEQGFGGRNRTSTEIIYFSLEAILPLLLDVSSNSVSGPIPDTLFGRGSLMQQLYARSNLISGFLPADVGQSPELVALGLSNNQIEGSIPSELGLLGDLVTLDLAQNFLSGSIPMELWNSPSLRDLDLSNNQISRPLTPLQTGHRSALERMKLSRNWLSSTLPSELGLMHSLCEVDLSHNALSGTIPHELGNICLRSIGLENQSHATAFTLFFGFAPDQEVRMPTMDEINVLVGQTYKQDSALIMEAFPNAESVNIVYVGGSLDESNTEFPLSLDLVIAIHYTAVVPDTDKYNDQLFDTIELENFLFNYIFATNIDLFLGARQVEYTTKDDHPATKPPVHLDLSFNNLSGTIPSELASLYSNGSMINLLGNNFTGSLPVDLCPWHCSSAPLYSERDQRGGVLRVDCTQIVCRCEC